jgi:hypothetical protein
MARLLTAEEVILRMEKHARSSLKSYGQLPEFLADLEEDVASTAVRLLSRCACLPKKIRREFKDAGKANWG